MQHVVSVLQFVELAGPQSIPLTLSPEQQYGVPVEQLLVDTVSAQELERRFVFMVLLREVL